jgi:hypothetical protein
MIFFTHLLTLWYLGPDTCKKKLQIDKSDEESDDSKEDEQQEPPSPPKKKASAAKPKRQASSGFSNDKPAKKRK